MAAPNPGRIHWSEGQYSSIGGTVNGIRLFTIDWRTIRADKDWILTSHLPHPAGRLGDFDTTAEAYAAAEETLEQFVSRIGARF
jgi:hypothetical protein